MWITRALAAAVVALTAVAASAQLSGGFFGIGAAQGMRLTLDGDGDGALVGPDGLSRPFSAEPVGDGFEAMIEGPEGRTLMRVLPAEAGARVVLAPVDPNGVMDADRMTALAFLRDGTELPQQPERFLPAPTGPVAAFDAQAFVDSYRFWEPAGAAFAFEAVAPKYRTVIRMFPLVHADILFRLCRLDPRPAAVAEAMRGQGVTCNSLAQTERRLRAGKGWERFTRDADRERAALLTSLACADDLLRRKPECKEAGDEVARRAVSMETVGTALARYR